MTATDGRVSVDADDLAVRWKALPKNLPDGVTAVFTQTGPDSGRVEVQVNGRNSIIVYGDAGDELAVVEWHYIGAVETRDALHYASAIVAAAGLGDRLFGKPEQELA